MEGEFRVKKFVKNLFIFLHIIFLLSGGRGVIFFFCANKASFKFVDQKLTEYLTFDAGWHCYCDLFFVKNVFFFKAILDAQEMLIHSSQTKKAVFLVFSTLKVDNLSRKSKFSVNVQPVFEFWEGYFWKISVSKKSFSWFGWSLSVE